MTFLVPSALSVHADRPEPSEIKVRCPRCEAVMANVSRSCDKQDAGLTCNFCLIQITRRDGVWNALPPDREKYFASFIADYEKIRSAEGRGSRNPEFYLALPTRDLSGRNQSQWNIRARTYQCLVSNVLMPLENRTSQGLEILDLGSGNCWMSYRLALRGHAPVAVDLLSNIFDGLGAAHHYQRRVPSLFPRFRAELDRLPFAGQQFDLAIFNASLHYSENYERTVGEAIRCLRTGGKLVIADTPWYRCQESGDAMLRERRTFFESVYGFASDAVPSLEFLTDERLNALASRFALRWKILNPNYGIRWRLRPWIAKFKQKREPSRFRIYVAEVSK